MTMRKLLILSLFILMLTGCSSTEHKEKENIKIDTISIPIGFEEYNIDPNNINNLADKNIVAQLYDGLTYINPSHNKVSPLISTSYSHSNDYKTWIFELRDDIKFSDGSIITPEIVISSINKSKLKEYTPLFTIKNENNKISFNFETPCFQLDEILANPEFAIIDPNSDFTSPTSLKTTGAYKVKSIDDTSIRLERNNNYWDNENTKIDNITFEIQKDAELAYQMTTQDLYNIFGTNYYEIPKYKLNAIKSMSNTLSFNGNNISFIYMNPNNNFKDDINLRKALLTSIERKNLINVGLNGTESPITSLFPENSFEDYDIQTSKKLFKNSLYDAKSEKSYRLIIRNKYGISNIAELMLINWNKLYNIPIKAEILTDETFYSTLKNGNYDIALDIYEGKEINSYGIFNYISNYYSTNIDFSTSDLDSYIKSLKISEKNLIDNGIYSLVYKNSYLEQINNIKFISTNIYGITYIKDIQ